MPVIAAKAATSTMPIVYMSNDDPRKFGLVFSLQKLKTRVGRQIFRLFHQVPYDGTTWNMDPSPLQQLGPNFSHHTFSSAANGGVEIGYAVAVPNSYATSPNRRYPVIYALHGITMDEVSIATYYARSVFNIAGTADIIWVFPNGGRNSKFIDAVPGSPMFLMQLMQQLWAEFDSLGIPHGALDILQGIGHTDVILMTITEPSAWAIAISGGAQDSTRTQGPPGPPGRPGPQP